MLELLEKKYPDKLRGLLPRIYAGSNLDADGVRGLAEEELAFYDAVAENAETGGVQECGLSARQRTS